MQSILNICQNLGLIQGVRLNGALFLRRGLHFLRKDGFVEFGTKGQKCDIRLQEIGVPCHPAYATIDRLRDLFYLSF